MLNSVNERIDSICLQFYKGNFTEFAKAVDIPPSSLRMLAGRDQRGEKPQDPKYEQLMKIYKATGVDLDWLLLGEGSAPTPDESPTPDASKVFVRSDHIAPAPEPASTPADTSAPAPVPASPGMNLSDALEIIKSQQSIIERQAAMLERLLGTTAPATPSTAQPLNPSQT